MRIIPIMDKKRSENGSIDLANVFFFVVPDDLTKEEINKWIKRKFMDRMNEETVNLEPEIYHCCGNGGSVVERHLRDTMPKGVELLQGFAVTTKK